MIPYFWSSLLLAVVVIFVIVGVSLERFQDTLDRMADEETPFPRTVR